MEKSSKQRHTCRLCYRRFANGRALGGHMRTHGGGGGGGGGRQKKQQSPPSLSSSSSGSGYVLRENPKKSFKVADPEFSSVVQDTAESDAGSYESLLRSTLKLPITPASYDSTFPSSLKRPRADLVDASASSASETTPDEDVARCLVMLSRDVWMQEDRPDGEEEDEDDGEEEDEEEEEEEEEEVVMARGRSRYQCTTCKKVFKSYQALGGHRASHKRVRTCASLLEVGTGEAPARKQVVSHECPFCFKVFSSGQALGGHKRSHLVAGHVLGSSDRSAVSHRLIDLNLPAPADESESFSAVSDAEH